MTEAAETQKIENRVEIEDAGPATKKITITIPADLVRERVDESIATLTHEAALPGFRKGRAPRHLIERRFGSSARTEAKNQLVADAYAKAIEDNKVQVVGDPEASEGFQDLEIEPGKDLVFAVDVEVVPEFDLPDLEGLAIKKPIVEITDELIEKEFERQLIKHGTPHPVTGKIERGDRVQGRVVITKENGDVVFEHNEAVVLVPDDEGGHLLGFLIDDLGTYFVGKTIGDTVKVDTVGPENHERADVRGEKLSIELAIEAGERIEPATPEAMIELYHLGDEEKLREQVKVALDQRAEQEQSAAMREQVHEYLQGAADFEVPARMSERQAGRVLDRTRVEMLYRGMTVDEVESRLAELRAESEAEAQKRLKLFFMLHAIADHYKIEVSEPEVNGRIAQIAAQRGERPEQLRAALAREGRLEQIGVQIREHKAADRIVDQAKVQEITADEWNVIVQEKSSDGEPSSKKKSTTKKKTTTKKKSTPKKKTGSGKDD